MKKVAIAGNPNSGKSTIFNNLTGENQKVGNWPGVTVEKFEGKFKYNDEEFYVVDLPGTYGLSSFSIDERIAREYLIKENPDVIVLVVDSTNIERHFYFLTELLEMGKNVVLCLNMTDLAEEKGTFIDENMLSKILKINVVKTIGNKNIGTDKLKEIIYESSKNKREDFLKIDYGKEIEDFIENLKKEIKIPEGLPERWTLVKIFSKDEEIISLLKIKKEIIEKIDKISYFHGFSDSENLIIEKKYGFIKGILKECVYERKKLWKRLEISDKVDKVITNPWIGLPIFLIIMLAIFEIIFGIGNPLQELIDKFISFLNSSLNLLLKDLTHPLLLSFLTDGVIGGIGSVIVFIPNIFLLFFLISILEDSGYMARIAFTMDRFMHYIGLHGKSFIPIILGFGCNVPAILATRTIESKRDRIITIMIIPLISCSARLPIYILFCSAFFKNYQGIIVFSLYLIGILLSIIVAKILSGTIFRKKEEIPLIMELPPYRKPAIRWCLKMGGLRTKVFLIKAGTIIFSASLIIWLLASLPPSVPYGSKNTVLGKIGSFIAPIFSLAGFGRWEIAIALLTGIVAKETVVATLGVVFGSENLINSLRNIFTPISAYSFMLMSLIYIPCIATMAAIKNEIGFKYLFLTIIYTILLGWVIAVIFYQTLNLFF
jgi:ferrous iron transport protein B